MRIRSIYLTLVAALFFVGSQAAASELIKTGERAAVSDFELKDLKGKPVKLSDFKDKVITISFWASWCEPCKQELSFFNKFYKKYEDKGLQVLSIATDAPETIAKVRQIVKRKRWKIPTLLDTDGSVSAVLNPRGATPLTMFVDRTGKLAMIHEGYASGDELMYEPLLEKLLAE